MIISNKLRRFFLLSLIIGSIISVYNCAGDESETEDKTIEENIDKEVDKSATTIVQFENTLFSIPSPYEIAYLVKNQKIDFNKEYLNPVNRSHNYVNNFKKALNLGVYGADLGYLNIYEQIPDAASYFGVIKILSQELDISNAFDNNTIKRIENNMGNKDSLLYIISNTYRNADKYLKDNNRNDIGVLILTGGWIESFNILIQIAQKEKNPEIIKRIGEQKYPLENLIKILAPYNQESDNYAKLINDLIELAYIFDGIDVQYTYIEPEIKPEEKLTIVNSKTELVITSEQLNLISEKLSSIRNNIIE